MSEIQWGSPQPRLKWWQHLLPKSRRLVPTHQVETRVTTFEESGVEMVRLKCYVRPLGGIYYDANSTNIDATWEATK